MNSPDLIGLNNLQPGDRVVSLGGEPACWRIVTLVERQDVPRIWDIAVGPFWLVRADDGQEWQTTGEMMMGLVESQGAKP